MSQRASGIERAAGLGVVVSLAGVLAAVVRSKTAALLIGPEGVGVVGEVLQFVTLGFVPLGAFSGVALMNSLARAEEGARAREVGAALGWLLALGAVTSLGLVSLAPWLLPMQWRAELWLFVSLTVVSVWAGVLGGVATQALLFRGDVGTSARASLVSLVISTVLVVAATAAWGLLGQFISMSVTGVLSLGVLIFATRVKGPWPASVKECVPSFDFLKRAFALGITGLIAGGALQLALYSIRWRLELTGGPELNGQFQAAWAVGSMYLSMVLSGVANFAFPRYAVAKTTEALQAEVDATADFVAKYAPPLVLLAASFSGLAISLLYSSKFSTAAEILRWQLAGDVAKCFSWAWAGPLLYRGRVRAFLFTESSVALLMGGLPWLLIPLFGPVGVGISYCVSYALYAVIVALVARRSLQVTPRARHVSLFIVGTLVLSVLATLSLSWWVRGAALLVSATWLWRAGALSRVLNRLGYSR